MGTTMRVMHRLTALVAVAMALLGHLGRAVMAIQPNTWALPRVIHFAQHAWVKKGHAKVVAGGREMSFRVMLGALLRPAAQVAVVVVLLAVAMHFTGTDPAAALAITPVVGSIDAIRADHAKLAEELEKGQKEMEGGPISQARGEELAKKAAEALELQKQIDAYDRVAAAAKAGKRVPDPALPGSGKQSDAAPPEEKAVAGYMTLGEYVTSDPAFQKASAAGFPKGTAVNVSVAAMIAQRKNAIVGPNGEPLVPLTSEERKQREEFLREQKAAPTIGTGIIEPDRVARIAQVTADDRFTLRDVLDVSPTSSDAVKYVREESFTNAAAVTAQGGTKPESAVEYSSQTADIEVIAHHMPVHNQQLADWPALRSLIDGRLRYGLRRAEEGYVMYEADDALLTVAGTTDIAALARYNSSDHTILDVIRMGVTEVRRAGYDPNAVLIDPIDWEEAELLKGTDDRYVWAVIRDALGPRVWSLRVVETTAAEAREGVATEARNLLVGDYRNGATLYDRMAATVMAGWINDQFVKNMQTLLAEERVGLAVFAPAAFAKFETQASAT